jgi:outer membrane protein TolC
MSHGRVYVAGALVLLTILAARGAERPYGERTWWGTTQLPAQWRRGIPRSPALDVPSPITRDETVEGVTLKEAIGMALANNPRIAARRLEPLRQESGILQAQAQFDPTLAGELLHHRSTLPNTNTLAGQANTIEIDDRTANFHLLKLFRSGTQLSVDFLNERLDNTSGFNELRPQYTPELNFSVVQPLLRGFGWDFSYLVVRIAEKTADAARAQYEAELANFVELVVEAYWEVVRARENVEVQAESKALALRTVEENQARVRVGLLAPVAVLEAQADAASREEQLIVAENDLDVARYRLAQLVYYRPEGTFVPRNLEPTDELVTEEVAASLDESLDLAMVERPEIYASARTVEAQQLNERIAGNQLLPRLDLVGNYGLNGTSGVGQPISFTSTVLSPTDLGGGRCARTSDGTQFICNVSVSGVSPFAGPKGDAYDRLTSNDFRSYSFGLQFQVPLSNALARSQYTQSRIARDQAELDHRRLLSEVTLEVRQSIADVVAGRQRIDTSRVARELAAENLRNQEKRHEVGMATTKDLLDFQTRLTEARAAEVASKVDHAIAVSRWRRAEGRLLAHYQILVEQPGRDSPPWFARF